MAEHASVAELFRHEKPASFPLAMYALSKELKPMAEGLQMLGHFEEMRQRGYTVLLPTPETLAIAEEVRSEILRISEAQLARKDPKGGATPRLLGHPEARADENGRSVFERFLCEPRQAALAEYMCGAGFILSQLVGSRKTAQNDAMVAAASPLKTGHAPGLHADQSWMPSPYPEHNMLLTTCLVTDDAYESEEGGATCVLPGTHLLRTSPPVHDAELMRRAYQELRPILAPKGSIVCWDGMVWHAGGWRRQEAGERVVMHCTFARLYVRTVERYKDVISEELLARNPKIMRQLVGREDFLDHSSVVGKELLATYEMALAGKRGVARKLDWRSWDGGQAASRARL